MLSKMHQFSMAGSDTQDYEFSFERPGRIMGCYVYGLTSQATDVRIYAGEYIFSKGLPMEAIGGASNGYRIPLEDGIPVSIGDTVTVELTDRSGAANVVRVGLVGMEAEGKS